MKKDPQKKSAAIKSPESLFNSTQVKIYSPQNDDKHVKIMDRLEPSSTVEFHTAVVTTS